MALAAILMTLAAAVAIAYALSLNTEPEIRMGTQHKFVGAQAPASTLEDLAGEKSTDLIQLRGKLVLLIFWGPWDPTSAQMAPHWNELWQRYRENSNFAMVTVACESPHGPPPAGETFADSVRDYLKRADLSFPVWQDPEGLARNAFYMDQAEYPLTVLVGPEGYLRAVWYGPVPGMQAELDRLIDRYLEEFNES